MFALLSVALTPAGHPYRAFQYEVLAATDEADRFALGHEWRDCHRGGKLAVAGIVLLLCLFCVALIELEIAGVHHVVVHHYLWRS